MKSEIERRVDDVKNRREDIRDQLKSRLRPHPPLSASGRLNGISSTTKPYTPSSTTSAANGKGKATAPSNDNNTPPASATGTAAPVANGGTLCVKVVCRYRAELYFKMTRQTKFERLFKVWASRMDLPPPAVANLDDDKTAPGGTTTSGKKASAASSATPAPQPSSTSAPASPQQHVPLPTPNHPDFIYTHNGRPLADDLTVDDVGIEDGDTIVAIELVDTRS